MTVFHQTRYKKFSDWFGMIRIGSDTDIGMNRNSSDWLGMNLNPILSPEYYKLYWSFISFFESLIFWLRKIVSPLGIITIAPQFFPRFLIFFRIIIIKKKTYRYTKFLCVMLKSTYRKSCTYFSSQFYFKDTIENWSE